MSSAQIRACLQSRVRVSLLLALSALLAGFSLAAFSGAMSTPVTESDVPVIEKVPAPVTNAHATAEADAPSLDQYLWRHRCHSENLYNARCLSQSAY